MNPQDANDPFDTRRASNTWLTVYRYYLVAAVVLSVIGIAKLFFSSFGSILHFLSEPFSLFLYVLWPLIINIAKIGLFVFAINSLHRVGESWVRTLHLWINGTAVAMALVYYLITAGDLASIWSFWVARIFLQIGGLTVFPIGELIPWRFLLSHYPYVGEEQASVMLIIRLVVTTAALVPAVFWCIRWSGFRQRSPNSVRN